MLDKFRKGSSLMVKELIRRIKTRQLVASISPICPKCGCVMEEIKGKDKSIFECSSCHKKFFDSRPVAVKDVGMSPMSGDKEAVIDWMEICEKPEESRDDTTKYNPFAPATQSERF